jgi:hypothetical protein
LEIEFPTGATNKKKLAKTKGIRGDVVKSTSTENFFLNKGYLGAILLYH